MGGQPIGSKTDSADGVPTDGIDTGGVSTARTDAEVSRSPGWAAVPLIAALVIGLGGLLLFGGDATDPAGPDQPPGQARTGVDVRPDRAGRRQPAPNQNGGPESNTTQQAEPAPPELLAAERFATTPSAQSLRQLLQAVGGLDGLTVATADGAFDVVQFDPKNPNRLLASHRRSYGQAGNQDSNERWQVTPAGVVETVAVESLGRP